MERVIDASRERNDREQKKRAPGGSVRFYRDSVIWKNLIVICVAWFSTLMVHFGLIREDTYNIIYDVRKIYGFFYPPPPPCVCIWL